MALNEDVILLRELLRRARKAARRIERMSERGVLDDRARTLFAPERTPEPPPPRWLLTGEQLHFIAGHIRLGDAGTYAKMAEELGIAGDLYAMIAETYSAACRLPSQPHDKGAWLESYLDAKHAYAWHLAEADARADHRAKE